MFSARCLWHPKDKGFEKEYEDAFAVAPEQGLAAVADGVSSAIFSRQWARILTAAAVENPPESFSPEDFNSWLGDLRRQWLETIDFASLDYFKRAKLKQVGGAYSTLLWFRLEPIVNDEVDNQSQQFRLQAGAFGDCCMFHFRDGELLATFPVTDSATFAKDPVSVCSVNRGGDLLPIETAEFVCQRDDVIILATDAIAYCAFQHADGDRPFPWEDFWELNGIEWVDRIASLRSDSGMRFDDTTVVMMRIGAEPACEVVEPEELFVAELVEQEDATSAPVAEDGGVDGPAAETSDVEDAGGEQAEEGEREEGETIGTDDPAAGVESGSSAESEVDGSPSPEPETGLPVAIEEDEESAEPSVAAASEEGGVPPDESILPVHDDSAGSSDDVSASPTSPQSSDRNSDAG